MVFPIPPLLRDLTVPGITVTVPTPMQAQWTDAQRDLLLYVRRAVNRASNLDLELRSWAFATTAPLRASTDVVVALFGGDADVPPGICYAQHIILSDTAQAELYVPVHSSVGRLTPSKEWDRLLKEGKFSMDDAAATDYASLLTAVKQWPHCLDPWQPAKPMLQWSRGWFFARLRAVKVYVVRSDLPYAGEDAGTFWRDAFTVLLS